MCKHAFAGQNTQPHLEKKFQLANGMRGTCSLVEIHNIRATKKTSVEDYCHYYEQV